MYRTVTGLQNNRAAFLLWIWQLNMQDASICHPQCLGCKNRGLSMVWTKTSNFLPLIFGFVSFSSLGVNSWATSETSDHSLDTPRSQGGYGAAKGWWEVTEKVKISLSNESSHIHRCHFFNQLMVDKTCCGGCVYSWLSARLLSSQTVF